MSDIAPTERMATDSQTAPLRAAYRHDAHKFFGVSHGAARTEFAGVPVNRRVPLGADQDAAALSRPGGAPEQTVATHATHYRLSLCTGDSQFDRSTVGRTSIDGAVRHLLCERDPDRLHERWLSSAVAASFNESVYYPYTSLKYHTLLVVALLAAYRSGADFADLKLVVDPPETRVPHRTVYADDRCALRIDVDGHGRPSAPLGSRPTRSWASVWSRLPAHPLDTDGDQWAMALDANLRRIRSWSTALQYLEDVRTREGQS